MPTRGSYRYDCHHEGDEHEGVKVKEIARALEEAGSGIQDSNLKQALGSIFSFLGQTFPSLPLPF